MPQAFRYDLEDEDGRCTSMLPRVGFGLLRRRTVHPAPGTAQPLSHTPQDVHRCPSRRPLIHATDGALLAHRSSVVMSTPHPWRLRHPLRRLPRHHGCRWSRRCGHALLW